MIWRWAADGVAFLHGVWVLLLILGPFWAVRRSRARGVVVGVLLATAFFWSFYCPLTVLENFLRSNYDPSHVYTEGFLAHYVRPCADARRYGPALAWGVRVWAGVWMVVYAVLWGREFKKRHNP
jgi:hypothetical protein